jgi:hypothetical protein
MRIENVAFGVTDWSNGRCLTSRGRSSQPIQPAATALQVGAAKSRLYVLDAEDFDREVVGCVVRNFEQERQGRQRYR